MVDVNDLHRRYVALYGEEGVAEEVLSHLEEALSITLPEEFKNIARFFGGGLLGSVSHYDLVGGSQAESVVAETLRLRDMASLPHRFLVIAEPSESLIVMDSTNSEVIWCDAIDINGLAAGGFSQPPDRWNSYGAFFEALLTEAEEETTRA